MPCLILPLPTGRQCSTLIYVSVAINASRSARWMYIYLIRRKANRQSFFILMNAGTADAASSTVPVLGQSISTGLYSREAHGKIRLQARYTGIMLFFHRVDILLNKIIGSTSDEK
jgi:hypothetical protein